MRLAHQTLIQINARFPHCGDPLSGSAPTGRDADGRADAMEPEFSDVVVGVMMTVFGGAGLFLAAGSHDDAMTVFGFSLMGFAVLFVGGLIKGFYDRRDAAFAAQAAHHD
jgi:hypothetical protein